MLSAGLLACDSASFIQAPDGAGNVPPPQGGNTNVNLGGAQDFGFFRRLLDQGVVPTAETVDDAGFFAEHHTPLPEPRCGERICLQSMLGVMGNLMNGANCTILQLGLNSPVVVDPENQPPLSLAVVVDTSGSMEADGKMSFLRQGLRRMLDELADDDRIALIRYSGDAELLVPMSPVAEVRSEMGQIIERLSPGGATNIWEGLELGYSSVQADFDAERQNRVIMISDGQASAGVTRTQDIIDLSRPYNSDGIGLTTIGLGTDFNLELMRGLAEQGDGNLYFVEDAAAVDEVFTEELAYFTVPVAFDLTLSVRAGDDFNFRQAYGSSRFDVQPWGGSLDIASVFLAHRQSHEDNQKGRRGGGSALLVELMPDPQSASPEAHVATVDVEFRDPTTGNTVRDTVVIEYPYPATTVLEEGFFDNEIVTKSFVMLNILVGIRESLDTYHRGDGANAVGILRRLTAAAVDYEDGVNDGLGDEDIRLDIELMRQLAEVMIANGALEPAEPDIPADPWPAD